MSVNRRPALRRKNMTRIIAGNSMPEYTNLKIGQNYNTFWEHLIIPFPKRKMVNKDPPTSLLFSVNP